MPDLTVCTNGDQSQTIIANTSEDTVWYIAAPPYSYWTSDHDFKDSDLTATVLLFRADIRTKGGTITAPTIEPGVTVSLNAKPSDVRLRRDPGEQAAWQEASLLVKAAVDKSRDAILSILEDASNPTNAAVIACVSAGYNVGQAISGQNQSQQEVQSELSDINKSTQECGDKIDEAQKAHENAGEAPAITLGRVAEETRGDPEWEKAGRLVREAYDLEHVFLKFHR